MDPINGSLLAAPRNLRREAGNEIWEMVREAGGEPTFTAGGFLRSNLHISRQIQ